MDKIRRKKVKGEVCLHLDIKDYANEFLELLNEGKTLHYALATVLLDQAASTAINSYDEYTMDISEISINVEEESATYEAELVHIEDWEKITI